MISANLLPWREEQRQKRDKKLLFGASIFWAICLAVSAQFYLKATDRLTDQNARNTYLKGEITKVDEEIKELEQLQIEKDALLSRIDVVQRLQHDRQQIIHIFDDMVRKLPKGTTLDSITKSSRKIALTGRAQSNSRVSELMNRLDTSQWFGESNLTVVNVKDEDNNQLSQFELKIVEKFPKDLKKKALEEGANSTGAKQ